MVFCKSYFLKILISAGHVISAVYKSIILMYIPYLFKEIEYIKEILIK